MKRRGTLLVSRLYSPCKNHRKNTTKGSEIGNDKEIYPPDEVGALVKSEIWEFTSISLDTSKIGFWFYTAD